jgi:hypothetical protein
MKMRSMVTTGILVALAASLLALPLFHGAARAQYPPPTGNVTLTAGTTAPTLGSTVPISATIRDQYGSVVAGIACTFSIISQPGTDASVVPGPVMTDPNGVAQTTLNVGGTAGTIVVGALCGELSAQTSVVSSAAAVGLPPTGTNQAEGTPAGTVWALSIAAGAALGIGGTLAVMAVRRTRPSRR